MSSLSGVHAVVIEDDQSSIDVLTSLLRQEGATFSTITYDIANQLASIEPPTVFFIDLEIPELNGYEVLSILQNSPNLAGVPLVAYTTHLSHMNSAQEAGFDSFLTKPLDRTAFADQVRRILAGEAVWE